MVACILSPPFYNTGVKFTQEWAVAAVAGILGGGAALGFSYVSHAPLPVRAVPSAVEMGALKTSTMGRGSFRLVNRSDHEVAIASTRTSCGCTAAQVPKTLAAGASVEVPVTMATAGASGTVEQAVTVTLKDSPDRPIFIPIRATVGDAPPTPAGDPDQCKAL